MTHPRSTEADRSTRDPPDDVADRWQQRLEDHPLAHERIRGHEPVGVFGVGAHQDDHLRDDSRSGSDLFS
jgi:hypothetical protein